MPIYWRGLVEEVPALSDNPAYMKRLRPRVIRGITLYRIGGAWHSGRDLSPNDTEGADLILRGGYVYDVDTATMLELIEQGFSAAIFFDDRVPATVTETV